MGVLSPRIPRVHCPLSVHSLREVSSQAGCLTVFKGAPGEKVLVVHDMLLRLQAPEPKMVLIDSLWLAIVVFLALPYRVSRCGFFKKDK